LSDLPLKTGFWTDRKAKVKAEAEAEERAALADAETAERAAQEEKSDEDLLQELGLPDPDTLKLGDDVKGFMSKAVPDRLRRRALRQLWTLNPVLANVDGLVDYGQDFTDSAMAVENLQTAYQVGKGMLGHVQEMARQAEEKLAALEGEEQPETDVSADAADASSHDTQDAPAGEESAVETRISDTTTENSATDASPEISEVVAPARRRMRFHYNNTSPSEAVA